MPINNTGYDIAATPGPGNRSALIRESNNEEPEDLLPRNEDGTDGPSQGTPPRPDSIPDLLRQYIRIPRHDFF
ncbi:MAG TPA: hypothetical protein VMZ03_14605 [Chitinophagaceae bacterium]|nr:hypothetical protein [Chitinophagaceae bacterium]